MENLLLLLIVIFIFILSSPTQTSCSNDDSDEDQMFDEYNRIFNKTAGRSPDEIEESRKIFLDRYKAIQKHNEKFQEGQYLFEEVVNKFTDLPDTELVKYTGVKIPRHTRGNSTANLAPPPNGRRKRAVAPLNFNYGPPIVQPVQDQGNCGSCYVRIFKSGRSNFYIFKKN